MNTTPAPSVYILCSFVYHSQSDVYTIGQRMAHSTPAGIAFETPFDDSSAIGSAADSTSQPSGQVLARPRRVVRPTGAWKRRWYSIFDKVYTILEPAHKFGHRHHGYAGTLVASICFSSGCAITVLGATDHLAYCPLILLFDAICSSLISLRALVYVAIPLYLAAYVAVFVDLALTYLLNQERQPNLRTQFIIMVSLWCAFMPLVFTAAWTMWTSGRRIIRERNQEEQRQPPLQTAIELEPLPHAPPPPVVLRHPYPTGTFSSLGHTHAGPARLPVVRHDGFQEVRDFV